MVKTSPSNAGGAGSIPGGAAKIPHASQPKNQNIKQKQYCNKFRDFPGGPVVKTSPSNADGEGSIPGRGAKIPRASQPKNQNRIRSNIVTTSVKT